MTRIRLLFAGALIAALGCAGNPVQQSGPLPALSDVSPAEWAALADRRIFFGHQSVGANVMEGMAEVLASRPEIHIRIDESKAANSDVTAAFYHAKIGRNEHPDEKLSEFVSLASHLLAAPGSIGMMKFCYVDVRADSDPQALFENYQRQMSELKRLNPGLTLVHFTMPLFVDEGMLQFWKLKLRGQHTERDRNIVRNQYNSLLLQAYAGKEPVFDVAMLESTRSDGSRVFFRHGDKNVFTMAPEYTDDGGHLRTTARQRVAGQLLIFLARLPRMMQMDAANRS